MQDVFDHVVLCNNCHVKTRKNYAIQDSFEFRILECPKCNNTIYHPADLKEYEDYKKLRTRNFDVKLRMVGNSFCVSIPKEIIDFHKEFEKEFNDLVRLSLSGPGQINMVFMSGNIYKKPRQ